MKKQLFSLGTSLSAFTMILLLTSSLGSCKKEELPITIRGKVSHIITQEPLENMVFKASNIRCSGFAPAVCNQINESRTTDEKGEFAMSYFQDCDSEIEVTLRKEDQNGKHKRFIYNEIADRDQSLSCNDLVALKGGESYYFEIKLQPQIYIDIYGEDDPNLELESFYVNDILVEVKQNASFQTRQKIDISNFKGEVRIHANYRTPDDLEMFVAYDYNREDEIKYTIKY